MYKQQRNVIESLRKKYPFLKFSINNGIINCFFFLSSESKCDSISLLFKSKETTVSCSLFPGVVHKTSIAPSNTEEICKFFIEHFESFIKDYREKFLSREKKLFESINNTVQLDSGEIYLQSISMPKFQNLNSFKNFIDSFSDKISNFEIAKSVLESLEKQGNYSRIFHFSKNSKVNKDVRRLAFVKATTKITFQTLPLREVYLLAKKLEIENPDYSNCSVGDLVHPIIYEGVEKIRCFKCYDSKKEFFPDLKYIFYAYIDSSSRIKNIFEILDNAEINRLNIRCNDRIHDIEDAVKIYKRYVNHVKNPITFYGTNTNIKKQILNFTL
jgi:hypothetical protein